MKKLSTILLVVIGLVLFGTTTNASQWNYHEPHKIEVNTNFGDYRPAEPDLYMEAKDLWLKEGSFGAYTYILTEHVMKGDIRDDNLSLYMLSEWYNYNLEYVLDMWFKAKEAGETPQSFFDKYFPEIDPTYETMLPHLRDNEAYTWLKDTKHTEVSKAAKVEASRLKRWIDDINNKRFTVLDHKYTEEYFNSDKFVDQLKHGEFVAKYDFIGRYVLNMAAFTFDKYETKLFYAHHKIMYLGFHPVEFMDIALPSGEYNIDEVVNDEILQHAHRGMEYYYMNLTGAPNVSRTAAEESWDAKSLLLPEHELATYFSIVAPEYNNAIEKLGGSVLFDIYNDICNQKYHVVLILEPTTDEIGNITDIKPIENNAVKTVKRTEDKVKNNPVENTVSETNTINDNTVNDTTSDNMPIVLYVAITVIVLLLIVVIVLMVVILRRK